MLHVKQHLSRHKYFYVQGVNENISQWGDLDNIKLVPNWEPYYACHGSKGLIMVWYYHKAILYGSIYCLHKKSVSESGYLCLCSGRKKGHLTLSSLSEKGIHYMNIKHMSHKYLYTDRKCKKK
jgi:hypothetical protein